jgi:CheY-like chemotaxis protein
MTSSVFHQHPEPTTVLIVEDDPHDLDAYSSGLLQRYSCYRILKAETIKAGLQEFQSEKIDCVVLDLDLAESSGFEVLLELIPDRKNPQIAVIILTKLASPHIRDVALTHGAVGYLVKRQTSPEQLHEAIQKGIASVRADRSTP